MYRDLIAGYTAGTAGLLASYPLDTVIVRLQSEGSVYKGLVDCIRKTIKHESLCGLYKGLAVPVVAEGIIRSMVFTGYGSGLRMISADEVCMTDRSNLPMTQIYGAVIFASTITIIPKVPCELIQTRLQAQSNSVIQNHNASKIIYRGAIDCLFTTIRREGVYGLYKGCLMLVVRDIFWDLLEIPSYEFFVRNTKSFDWNETVRHACGGAFAGCVGGGMAAPLSLIKNRMQVDQTQASKNVLRVISSVIKEEGIRGLLRGSLTCCLCGIVNGAVVFVAYENAIRIFHPTPARI